MSKPRKTRLRRLGLLAAGVCLTLALAVTVGGAKPASAAEISFAQGVPIPPSVQPVIVVKGTDYNMGYQYSQQLVQTYGPEMLQTLQRTFTTQQLLALKAYQWYTKKYTPELIDEYKGMAAGATDAGVPLSYAEVLANYSGVKAYPGTEPAGSQDDNLPVGGCSGFAAWGSTTKDGKLICSGSSDAEPGFNYLLVVFPNSGNNYIVNVASMYHQFAIQPGTLHPGMNNKGLCYVHHGSVQAGNEKPGYGVPRFAAIEHTLRFANSVPEALNMQLGYPSGIVQGGLWADTSGDAANIDCRNPQIIRRAGENGEKNFLYATNNCLTKKITPTKDTAWLAKVYGWDIKYVPHGGWTGMDEDAVRRNLDIWNMLHNYHGKVDLAFVKMMWRFPGRLPAYSSLEAADEGMYANQSAGWDSKICAQGNATIGICLPDNGDSGLYYVCNGSATKQANAQCPGYSYFLPEATHTFYQVQLASSPADAVSAAKSRAMYDLEYANIRLRKLTYADTAFAPLKQIFEKAVTEWYKGDYYTTLAAQTTGNASVINQANALSGYARCQAYANQVYEALVPPPSKPEDLGLRKYWGGWGQWTSWLGSH